MKDSQERVKYTKLVCSHISGYQNYYFPEHFDPIRTKSKQAVTLDQTMVTVREEHNRFHLDWYRYIVLHPILHPCFEWPIDVVLIGVGEMQKTFLIFEKIDENQTKTKLPIRKILETDDVYFHTDNVSEIKKIQFSKNFLKALVDLEKFGYIYHNFDVDRIQYDTETMEPFFPFCDEIRLKELIFFQNSDKDYAFVDVNRMGKHFAPPYVFEQRFDGRLSEKEASYQVAALLFKLLIGKLPYETVASAANGWALKVDREDYPGFIQDYLRYPRFIFDPCDKENCLPDTVDNEPYWKKWNSLSAAMREKFTEVLCQKTAEGRNPDSLPTPQDWLEMIEEWSPSKKL